MLNLNTDLLIGILRIVALVTILFVWVIRYDNIKNEFKEYKLPKWLRDLVGVLKITCVVLMNLNENAFILAGSVGLMILMTAALYTHFRVKNPFYKMLPALSMFSIVLEISLGLIEPYNSSLSFVLFRNLYVFLLMIL